ncbi:MAG: hypothetical protein RL761_924 [Pseudomonadota bacterium]|jgi:anti-sigma factor RsiW
MTHSNFPQDEDVIAFVAGHLDAPAYERIATAAKSDPALAAKIQALQIVRSRLDKRFDPNYSQADNEAAAQALLQKLNAPAPPRYIPTAHEGGKPWSPRRKRWTMAALAAQSALCLGLLGHLALPILTSNSKPSGVVVASRSAGLPAGQVELTVSFSPQTTEKEWRGLLLGVDAQLLSGPTQLGEYRLSVAANVADAALKKLQTTPFVERAKVSTGVVQP